MMGKDPVKRGLNAYLYCDSDPFNYVDPTGEIANIVAGGAAGSALEQAIGNGRVSLKESLVSGATNAVSGAIYGKGPLKGFGDALWKGAASGAATAGIRYLERDWDDGGSDLAGSVLGLVQGIGEMSLSPYSKNRDPRRGCGVRGPLSNRVGEPMTYGYRYDVGSLQKTGSVRRKKDGFSMLGLLKEAAIGGVMGGLAGAAFYGAGKAFGFLKDSIKDVRGKGCIAPATRPTHGQGFSDKGYNPKPG